MSEMILPLGDYETRDGKFDAKVVANNLSGVFVILAVLTSRKTGHVSYALYTMDGRYLLTGHEQPLDLVPLKPAPVMGPLDASDFIPGKTLIRNPLWNTGAVALSHNSWSVTYADCTPTLLSVAYGTMQECGWFYSNDCAATWQKCEKEVDRFQLTDF